MLRTQGYNRLRSATLLALLLSSASIVARAEKWIAPSPEELKMTSQPQVPGAPAVYLYREETTDDKMHVFSIYTRLKVLTDKGKEYSNVELGYSNRSGGGGYTVNDIEGRTIHPDGTVIPFTGKPFDKLVEKTAGAKYMTKIFTLPDVEVGSIIEYRYTLRYDDHYFISPQWYIQSPLFTRKAHYLWRPTSQQLVSSDDRGQLTSTIAWTPILPKGSEVKQTRLPGGEGQLVFEVNVQDVPPSPDEELMPPLGSLTYRVLFYYSPYRSNEDFWKSEGKHWSKLQDKFIGPGPGVSAAVQQITAGATTQDQKLRKLYAAIMEMENTDFTHNHSAAEESSQGLKQAKTTDDILARKRGESDQLAALFVAMARAAGMKAYVMTVTNRDRHLFLPSYFSLNQFDDTVAIVTVDGTELYFDPGSRYCPYGLMAWKHTSAGGMRQTDGGNAIVANTPGISYKASRVARVANLTMDEHGVITGKVNISYTGSPALHWRQIALTSDETTLERDLKLSAERMLPAGLEIKVNSIGKVKQYEEPLTAEFAVKGNIGSSTGKRVLLPSDLFEANSKPTFSHDKREVPVAFDYPYLTQDAVRVNFPASFAIESIPASEKLVYEKAIAYGLSVESAPTSVTTRREFALGEILFMQQEYLELRSFYGKFENKDQENVVLKFKAAATTGSPSGN
ncbi:hypothetical protein BH10ACI4_BH10ACI4_05500 [soil metagenome]